MTRDAIEAVAIRLAGDPGLGVRDRAFAVAMAHRTRLRLAICDDDASRLVRLYVRRRLEVTALALAYREAA